MKSIVRIYGGLGNQMFQYAFSQALIKEKEVIYDTDSFQSNPSRILEIESIFGISLLEASFSEKKKYRGWYFYFRQREYSLEKILKKCGIRIQKSDYFHENRISYQPGLINKRIAYFEGYFQSYKYFDTSQQERHIRSSFVFPAFENKKNKKLEKIINQTSSVSLHFRRGDYHNHPLLGGIATLEYYKRAVDYIIENIPDPTFFIFSDDIAWCQKNLDFLPKNSYFIGWNRGGSSFRDMQLMSLCKHNIIANSSFSWWGAWLNSNSKKKVICPSRWDRENIIDMDDLIPTTWVRK